MAKLYCESDGESAELAAIETKGKFEGEYTKVVKGKLILNGYTCDQCNVPLKEGDDVYFVEDMTEKSRDSREELHYIDIKNARVSRY